jgi:hypothetical protein
MWGMTELSPLGSLGLPKYSQVEGGLSEAELRDLKLAQVGGRPRGGWRDHGYRLTCGSSGALEFFWGGDAWNGDRLQKQLGDSAVPATSTSSSCSFLFCSSGCV